MDPTQRFAAYVPSDFHPLVIRKTILVDRTLFITSPGYWVLLLGWDHAAVVLYEEIRELGAVWVSIPPN